MTEVVHDMNELDYHAHPALSSSGARRLIQTCPATFKWERDNGPTQKRAFDFGHAAHGLILGTGQPLAIWTDTDSWRAKDAIAFRDNAYKEGHVPLLAGEFEQVQAMAATLRAHPLAARLLNPDNGVAEQSIFWTDPRWGVERRARLDWATEIDGLPVVVDYKTSTTADPKTVGRKVADFGYHQQHAWYLDAVRAADMSEDPAFAFIFQEKTPPYLVSVIELDERAVNLGRDLNEQALEIFRDCTASGVWPAYADETAITTVDVPRWAYNAAGVML